MPRAHIAALLLSLLAVLAPDLTLAPAIAGEPLGGPRPIDDSALPIPLRVPHEADTRTAGAPAPAPAPPPAPAPAPVQTEVADAPRYKSALDAARSVGLAYGVTFAAVRDGELLWAGGMGRQRDGRTELVADSPLVIGSVTKTYVAATILQLVEEGRLGLDDAVGMHLPELRGVAGKTTVRQLLDHTSGLADVFNDTTRKGLEEHPEHAWTTEEVLGSLHAPWYRPGEGWAYANTNYYLLSLIVERLTGATLADELERRFFGPLGMEATRILTPADATGPLAPAWTTIFWGSGAMSASAADVARWGDALYGGSLLSPTSRRAMLDLNDNDYGLGVQRIDLPGLTGYGHTGLLNTYTTLLLHLPTERVTLALLVNRSDVDLFGMLLAHPANGGPSLLELAIGHELAPPKEPQSP